MSRKQQDEYILGLQAEYELGAECADILDAAPVHAWFDQSETNIIAKLLDADAGDNGHAAREGLTAQLRAIRGLRDSLRRAVTAGNAAESQLKSLTPSEDDGET